MDPAMSSVILGLPGELISSADLIDHRVTKVGGHPVFCRIPPHCNVACKLCSGPLSLVLQAFAPLSQDQISVPQPERALYLYCCSQKSCSPSPEAWRAFRWQEGVPGPSSSAQAGPSTSGLCALDPPGPETSISISSRGLAAGLSGAGGPTAPNVGTRQFSSSDRASSSPTQSVPSSGSQLPAAAPPAAFAAPDPAAAFGGGLFGGAGFFNEAGPGSSAASATLIQAAASDRDPVAGTKGISGPPACTPSAPGFLGDAFGGTFGEPFGAPFGVGPAAGGSGSGGAFDWSALDATLDEALNAKAPAGARSGAAAKKGSKKGGAAKRAAAAAAGLASGSGEPAAAREEAGSSGAGGEGVPASVMATAGPALPEFYLYAEEEPPAQANKKKMKKEEKAHVERLLAEYAQQDSSFQGAALLADSSGGGNALGEAWNGEEYEKDRALSADPPFMKFSKRLQRSPQQCVRYCFAGEFIWPRAKLPAAPRCACCGAERVPELQVMSPLLPVLEEAASWLPEGAPEKETAANWLEGSEWQTVAVLTCSQSCAGGAPGESVFAEETVVVELESVGKMNSVPL